MVIIIYIALITAYIMYRVWHSEKYGVDSDRKLRIFFDDKYVRMAVLIGLILLVPGLIVQVIMPQQSMTKSFLLIPFYPGWILTKCMLGRSSAGYFGIGSVLAMLFMFVTNHIIAYTLLGKIWGYISKIRHRGAGT